MSEHFNALLERPKIQEIMDKTIKDNHKQEEKSDHKRLSNFCGRKEARVGLVQANEFSKQLQVQLPLAVIKLKSLSTKPVGGRKIKAKVLSEPHVAFLQ